MTIRAARQCASADRVRLQDRTTAEAEVAERLRARRVLCRVYYAKINTHRRRTDDYSGTHAHTSTIQHNKTTLPMFELGYEMAVITRERWRERQSAASGMWRDDDGCLSTVSMCVWWVVNYVFCLLQKVCLLSSTQCTSTISSKNIHTTHNINGSAFVVYAARVYNVVHIERRERRELVCLLYILHALRNASPGASGRGRGRPRHWCWGVHAMLPVKYHWQFSRRTERRQANASRHDTTNT